MFFTSSSRSSAPASHPPSWSNVEGLCVFNFYPADRSIRLIDRDDIRFRILAVSVSMALDLLRCSKGYNGLVRLGQAMSRNEEGTEMRAGEAAAWVQDFMARVPGTLPAIVIRDLGSTNARTRRFDWNHPAGRSFVAEQAAVIEFSSHLLDLATESRTRFENNPSQDSKIDSFTLVFRMGVTIAHELCHIFTSYLFFEPGSLTPPRVTYGASYSHREYGEAGRYWEGKTFGGYMDMRSSRRHAYVAVRDEYRRYAYIVKDAAVSGMLNRDFTSLPFVGDDGVNPTLVSRKEAQHWATHYDNVFVSDRRPPEKLPDSICNRLTSVGALAGLKYYVRGADMQRWLNTPRAGLVARQVQVLNM